MSAEATVEEARKLAGLLIENERGRVGNVDLAIHRVSARIMVDEGALKSLRYRWRSLKSIPAHVLENLRAGYEHFYESPRRALAQEIAIAEKIEPKSTSLETALEKARPLVGSEVE